MIFLISFFGLLITYYGLLVPTVSAQCPICIVTVGGGMLIAKKLGVDDLLAGIWISALNTAVSFWLASKFQNDKMIFKKILSNPWLLSILMFILTLSYFQFTNQIGHPLNKFGGIDKIIFGQTLGMLVMFLGNFIYGFSKFKNGGKALFPYSKVVFPVGLVLLTTFIFKLIFKL